jgi:hypothetical protein
MNLTGRVNVVDPAGHMYEFPEDATQDEMAAVIGGDQQKRQRMAIAQGLGTLGQMAFTPPVKRYPAVDPMLAAAMGENYQNFQKNQQAEISRSRTEAERERQRIAEARQAEKDRADRLALAQARLSNEDRTFKLREKEAEARNKYYEGRANREEAAANRPESRIDWDTGLVWTENSDGTYSTTVDPVAKERIEALRQQGRNDAAHRADLYNKPEAGSAPGVAQQGPPAPEWQKPFWSEQHQEWMQFDDSTGNWRKAPQPAGIEKEKPEKVKGRLKEIRNDSLSFREFVRRGIKAGISPGELLNSTEADEMYRTHDEAWGPWEKSKEEIYAEEAAHIPQFKDGEEKEINGSIYVRKDGKWLKK